jgi:beta-glucosidase
MGRFSMEIYKPPGSTLSGNQHSCVYEPNKPSLAESSDGGLDSGLIFGGAYPWKSNLLALPDIAKAQSWSVTPALPDIPAAVREVGDPGKAVISIYFCHSFVFDDDSGVKEAGVLLANFTASYQALPDVVFGVAAPGGRLLFALPRPRDSATSQHSDAPGYAESADGALFPFGYNNATR